MIELLLPSEFDNLEYSWVKATIGICTFVDYFVPKKRQHYRGPLVTAQKFPDMIGSLQWHTARELYTPYRETTPPLEAEEMGPPP
jgi:hypothetical protein